MGDFFSLGFNVDTKGMVSGLTVAERKLKQLERNAATATGMIQQGFSGGRVAALSMAQGLRPLDVAITTATRNMEALRRKLAQPAKSSVFRGFQAEVTQLSAARSEVVAMETAAAEAINRVKLAEQERTAAEAEGVRVARAGAAAREKAGQAQLATLATLNSAVVSGTATQLEAQRMLATGYASTVAQAERMAAVLVSAKAAGANPATLAHLERELILREQVTAATVKAGAAKEALAAASATMVGAENALLREKEILHALEMGYARTRAQAAAYADQKMTLNAAMAVSSGPELAALKAQAASLDALFAKTVELRAANDALILSKRAAFDASMTLAGAEQAAFATQKASMAQLTTAHALATQGVVVQKAELLKLAATYNLLRAQSMSPEGLAAWVANVKAIRASDMALQKRLKTALEAQAVEYGLRNAVDSTSGAFIRQGAAAHSTRSKFQQMEHSVTRLRTGLFSVLSIITILGFDKLVRGMFETAQQMNTVSRGLDIVTSSAGETAAVTERLMAMADGLGVSYVALAENFTKFSIASKGSLTLGESEKVFLGMSMALRALGKDQVDTQRVFKALEQMVGKGVVSMEELRGQLGESLPAATRVMARELGYTTAEFIKLVSQGLVPAASAVKGLGQGMAEDFAIPAAKAATSMAAVIDRIRNSFFRLFAGALEGGANEKLLKSLNALNDALNNPATMQALTNLINGLVSLTAAILRNVDVIIQLVKWTIILTALWAGTKVIFSLTAAVWGLNAAYAAAILASKGNVTWTALNNALLASESVLATAAAAAMIALARAKAAAAVSGTALAIVMAPTVLLWTGIALAIGFVVYKLIQLMDRTLSFAKLTGWVTGKVDEFTKAQMDQIKINEGVDSSLRGIEERLMSISRLGAEAKSALQSFVNVQIADSAIKELGFGKEALASTPAQAKQEYGASVVALAEERDDINKRREELSTQKSGRGGPSKLTEQLSLDAAEALIDADERRAKASLQQAVAVGELQKIYDDSAKSAKEATQDQLRGMEALSKYQRDAYIDLQRSQEAVRLLAGGYASTVEEAKSFAAITAGMAKRGADPANDAALNSKLQELQAQNKLAAAAEKALDKIKERTTLEEKLSELLHEQAAVVAIAGDKSLVAEADVGRAAEILRILWEAELAAGMIASKKLFEEVKGKAIKQEGDERRGQAAAEVALQPQRYKKQVDDVQRQIAVAEANRQDPRAETAYIVEQVRLKEQELQWTTAQVMADKSLMAGIMERAKGLQGVNAQLEESNRLTEVSRKITSDQFALSATKTAGFDSSKMDAREVGAIAESAFNANANKDTDPNRARSEALALAIQQVAAQEELNRQIEYSAQASVTHAQVWQGFQDKWISFVPVVSQIAGAFAQAADVAANQLGDAVANIALGLTTAKEAAVQLAQTMLREIIGALTQIAVSKGIAAIAGLFSKKKDDGSKEQIDQITKTTAVAMASMATLGAASIALANAMTEAWSKTALQVSMASYGASAALGAAAWVAGSAAQAAVTTATPKQFGGTTRKDQPLLVGETGREIFVPEVNGRILSHPDTTKLLAGHGRDPMAGVSERFAAVSSGRGPASEKQASGTVVSFSTKLKQMKESRELRNTTRITEKLLRENTTTNRVISFANAKNGGIRQLQPKGTRELEKARESRPEIREERPSALVESQVRAHENNMARRQFGGDVQAGVPVMVGEAGREMFMPRGVTPPAPPPAAQVPMQTSTQVSVPIKIEIVNNLGQQASASTRESTGPDGQRIIEIVLNAVAEDIANNGRVARTMSGRFGLSTKLGGR